MPGPRERWKLEPGMRQDVFSLLLSALATLRKAVRSPPLQPRPGATGSQALHPMFQPPGERWLTSISRNLGKGVDFDAFYSNVHI